MDIADLHSMAKKAINREAKAGVGSAIREDATYTGITLMAKIIHPIVAGDAGNPVCARRVPIVKLVIQLAIAMQLNDKLWIFNWVGKLLKITHHDDAPIIFDKKITYGRVVIMALPIQVNAEGGIQLKRRLRHKKRAAQKQEGNDI